MSSLLVLQNTKKFSVFALNISLEDKVHNNISSDAIIGFDGDDIPLDDTCLQILLESLNLTPASTTLKQPTINPITLPFILFENKDKQENHSSSTILRIEQDTEVSKMGQGGTGGIIWESSKACTHFILHHYELNNDIEFKKTQERKTNHILPHLVIEIGSGTGLLGISTATLFHDRKKLQMLNNKNDDDLDIYDTKFILTDQRNVVPLLERNLKRNSENNHRYNMNNIKTFPVDWNVDNDREKLIEEIKKTVDDIKLENRNDEKVKEDIEVLILCSDLVFGNNYENLINLMEEIHMLFIHLNNTTSSHDDNNQTDLNNSNLNNIKNQTQLYHCQLLFCFEEREDRFPSPGFHNRLADVFNILKVPTSSLPINFTELFPRIDISWLSIPSTTPACSFNNMN